MRYNMWPHGILQAAVLECMAFPFSRGSSQPRDQTQVSRIAGRFFFFFLKHLFIYLAFPGLNCGMWELVPWPGIKPRTPELRAWSLCHWATREIPAGRFFTSWATKGSPRILEWVAYSFSSRSSPPRNWTGVSCIAGRFFTNWAIREAPIIW